MTPGFEPFIRSIVSAPDDDLPRLVAADWLDEYGEPERAEFVRVQVELSRLESELRPASNCVVFHLKSPSGSCKRCAPIRRLRRREGELLAAHGFSQYPGSKWVDAECPELWRLSDRGTTFAFSRGFVSAITCAAADWLAHADAILAACPIRDAKDGVVRLTTRPQLEQRTGPPIPSEQSPPSYHVEGRLAGCATWRDLHVLGISPFFGMNEQGLLAAEWPGVRFKLPPAFPQAAPWATTAHPTPLADLQRVLRATDENARACRFGNQQASQRPELAEIRRVMRAMEGVAGRPGEGD